MKDFELQILLATYNSSRFLRAQLDSLLAQDWQDFEVLIRDGGSTDDTLEIVADYQRKHPERIRFLGSSPASAVKNFSSLLAASTAPLIMFSDHDDVWKPDKVRATVEKYHEAESSLGSDTPIMVFTDSEVVDSELKPISPSMIRFQNLNPRDLTLNRLIVQNVPSGNTMLLNRALADLANPIPAEAVMHDHWLTLAAASMGRIVFLDEPTMYYRQHSSNVYGASNYSLPTFLHRLKQGRKKIRERFQQNIDQAVAFGNRYGGRLNENDRKMIEALKTFQTLGAWSRRKTLWKYGIWKSGFWRNIGTILFI